VTVESSGASRGRARLLLVHRYFWPDSPPYAVMLRAIATHWAARGHDVEVLSSQPSYTSGTALRSAPRAEEVDGFAVRRLRMRPDREGVLRRQRNMVRFSLLVALRVLFGPRRDVVMCSTVPQVLLGWATSWAASRRGAAFVYHCMDLHPEIGRLSGEFSHPLVYRLLMRLDIATCRRAAAVVLLSDDMRDALLSRDPALVDRIVVLNNFDLPEYGADDAEAPIPRQDDVVTVVFTGNLGRFQSLDTLVTAVLSDAPAMGRIRLVLMGEGAAASALADQVAAAPRERRDRVVLLPHGSVAQARALMRIADWGLVSLAPEVIRYAYPSKTATYLSEGLPVLAAVESGAALARDVEAWGVGMQVPLGSPATIASALALLLDRGDDEQTAMRERAREVWRREFAVDRRLARWEELLDRVGVAAGAGTGAAR
jgi:glycosyltransferase involved in cell wall biosynthesis